jgi:hypothetical protein
MDYSNRNMKYCVNCKALRICIEAVLVCMCTLLAPSDVLAGEYVNVQFSLDWSVMQMCVLQEPSVSYIITLNFPNSLCYYCGI